MLCQVEGIVIRSTDYGEGNKIITLYARETGKAAIMVRGAKKTGSRHSAIAQLFTHGHYIYYLSRPGAMGTLNSGEIVEAHHGLRENLQMTAYSAYLAEMTDRILGEQDASDFLFSQLAAALNAIEEGKDPQIIAHIFEMKMLEAAGYAPALEQCVACGTGLGTQIPRGQDGPVSAADAGAADAGAFSSESGGWLCPRCRRRDPSAVDISLATLRLMRLFQKMDLRNLGKIELKAATRAQLGRIIRSFFDTHIPIQWKSRNFIEQMEKFYIV
jgi:DNA repair protein RecO (recombination protein O)